MSLACEGKTKNEPMMSPSLGSASLNGGSKFGVEGANVNRMLALSEKSRPINAKAMAQVGCYVSLSYTLLSAGLGSTVLRIYLIEII